MIVADLNTPRDVIDGERVAKLVTNVNVISEARETLPAAAYVTSTFYEPDALDAVTTATESGFRRGRSKESYVRVSGKPGCHLYLFESRKESFHFALPEL